MEFIKVLAGNQELSSRLVRSFRDPSVPDQEEEEYCFFYDDNPLVKH